MDGEGRPVDNPVSLDDVALVVDEDKVADADVGEGLAERVDPEVVGALRVPGRDMTGHSLLVAEVGEQPEGGGQAPLAVEAFLFDGVERRRKGKAEFGHGSDVSAP